MFDTSAIDSVTKFSNSLGGGAMAALKNSTALNGLTSQLNAANKTLGLAVGAANLAAKMPKPIGFGNDDESP